MELIDFIRVVFFCFVFSSATQWGRISDYCIPSLCIGSHNIACNHSGAYGPSCSYDRRLLGMARYKDKILSLLNYKRHLVAAGKVPGYLPAKRMATMLWDDELRFMAALNAARCEFGHDSCRNTLNFHMSGQTLFMKSYPFDQSMRETITEAINLWTSEFLHAHMSIINRFQYCIGYDNFTTIINDKNNRVGCALATHSKNNLMEIFFVCNYAKTNLINDKVYQSGPIASGCLTGTNPQFPALCGESEPIDPNEI